MTVNYTREYNMNMNPKQVSNGETPQRTVAPQDLPRLVAVDIEESIIKEQYHHFEGTTMTVCCLTLRNGFHVTGESACIHPVDFNAELGRKYAKDMAFKKAFDHEAYMLKQRMFVFGK